MPRIDRSTSSIGRRQMLNLLGAGAGAAALTARPAAVVAGGADLPALQTYALAAPSCVLSPELTEGPYFVDERLNRSDLRTGTTSTNVTGGVPLTLSIGIVSATGACVPLPGLQVDIWHCDAAGKYSDVASEGTSGQTFLRGYQVTDSSGLVNFTTIYPGWYTGRAVHVHVMVRQYSAAGGTTFRWTSQFFFDPATTLGVIARAPYNTRGTTPDRTNTQDAIYNASGGATLLATSGSAASGFTAAITLAVAVDATTPGAAPEPPSGLHVVSVSGNDVTLQWTAPGGGATPTGYVVEGGATPGGVLGTFATGSTAPVFRFTVPNGAFYVRVHTLAGSVRSAASNEVPLMVGPVAAPSAPSALLSAVTGTTVVLAWRNTFTGGTPTGLVLDVAGDLSASIPLDLGSSTQFAGVPAGTYQVRLRAVNGAGASPASDAAAVVVPSACSGAPLAPENFLAYRIGSTLYASWDPASSGPAPTGFVLSVSGAYTGTIPTAARQLSGVVGAGTYVLSVAAVNPCGTSAATAAQEVTVS